MSVMDDIGEQDDVAIEKATSRLRVWQDVRQILAVRTPVVDTVSESSVETTVMANHDTGLLFSELGWLMGQYPILAKYDDSFLEIADMVEANDSCSKTRIVDLLTKIEDEGHKVDWESCVPVMLERQSWWVRFKAKCLQWFRLVVG